MSNGGWTLDNMETSNKDRCEKHTESLGQTTIGRTLEWKESVEEVLCLDNPQNIKNDEHDNDKVS